MCDVTRVSTILYSLPAHGSNDLGIHPCKELSVLQSECIHRLVVRVQAAHGTNLNVVWATDGVR